MLFRGPPASYYEGQTVKAVSPVNTPCNHRADDTSLVGADVVSHLTRNQIFLIMFDLAKDPCGLDSSSIPKLI